ncbi:MAG TPA: hypothetical protein VFV50_07905, partial [Bdellovibrionales bacterium]|nr:hypothetical protein [Bdellovibrionales bacterium]
TPNCPEVLQIEEVYDAGVLKEIEVRAGRGPNPSTHAYRCTRFDGQPTPGWDQANQTGFYLTCQFGYLPGGRGVGLVIQYDQARRDPSDYGWSDTYTIQRTPEGARAHWGRTHSPGGRPVFCEYR